MRTVLIAACCVFRHPAHSNPLVAGLFPQLLHKPAAFLASRRFLFAVQARFLQSAQSALSVSASVFGHLAHLRRSVDMAVMTHSFTVGCGGGR